jgi:hypothetical protein
LVLAAVAVHRVRARPSNDSVPFSYDYATARALSLRVPTLVSSRRFWPGFVGVGIAVAFIAFVLAVPNIGGGACMESYPLQCPIVEVESSGLAATAVGLIASVMLLFFSSASNTSKVRISGVVVGFAALTIVVIVGLNMSLAHSIELRYY